MIVSNFKKITIGENKFLYNLQSASPFKNGIPFIITGTKTNEEAVQALYK